MATTATAHLTETLFGQLADTIQFQNSAPFFVGRHFGVRDFAKVSRGVMLVHDCAGGIQGGNVIVTAIMRKQFKIFLTPLRNPQLFVAGAGGSFDRKFG